MRAIIIMFGAAMLAGCLDGRPGSVESDARADVLADSTVAADADTDASDTDTSADVADDTAQGAPCEGPLRVSPRRGPAAGGTLLIAEGQKFYIGALTWMMKIGDAPATEMLYAPEAPPEPCRIVFRTRPHAAGTYDVAVYYGIGEPDPQVSPSYGLAGPFTYE